MNTKVAVADGAGQEQLLNELQGVLKRQIELVRRGDFRDCEVLAEKTGLLVERLKEAKAPQRGELREQFERTTKLYREAILIIATEKDRLGRQLGQVNRGRKTLRAYRGRS